MDIVQRVIFPIKAMPLLLLGLPACAATPDTAVIGEGAFEYQYTLYEARPAGESSTQKIVARNTPYRLFLIDGSIGGQPFYHGVTDNDGKTIIVRSETEIKPENVVLVKRIGDGSWGHMFVLNYDASTVPVAGRPYRLTMKCPHQPKRTYKGYTDAQGNTLYITSDQICKLSIETPSY